MTKSSEPRQTEDVSVYTVAAATLERLEKLPLGSSDYLDFFNVGIAATGAVRVQSAAFVCPVKLAPVAEAVLHEFELCTKHLPRFGAVTGAIVALHGDSLDEYPALAECLRGPRGQRLIRTSVVSADDQGREIAKLTSAVAKQLHERNLLEPWSGHLAVTVPELEERLKAAKLRHEQHCQSEAHRQAGEVASAEVAELERERVDLEREWSERLRLEDREAHCRRESLAAWYSGKYAAYVFEIGPPKTAKRRMTGAEAAKNLLAGDEFLHYFAAQGSGTLAYRAGK